MSGIQENQKTNPTSSEINLLQQENSLDLGVHLRMRQNLTGAERQRLAENYFYSRPLEEQRMLAKEIAALRGMKSESRFRTKVLQLLARTFISGVKVD
jgi:hypothetical protein